MARPTLANLDDSPDMGQFDWVIHAILSSIVIFLPLAFGGTQNWTQEIFFSLTACLLLAVMLQAAIDPSASVQWSWAYLPILLFILLNVAQLIAWPTSIVASLSPHTTELRSSLLTQPVLSHQSFTLYPLGTTQNLRLVLAVSGIFFSVTQFYRSAKKIEQLLIVIAVAGLAVSCVAAYQNLTGATTVYGIVAAEHPNSGPFMNYGHFGQSMNLAIGATLGLGLMRWMATLDRFHFQFESFSDVRRFMSLAPMRLVTVLICAIVIEALTLFFSLSRMGIISFIIAGAVTAALLSWRGRSRDKGSVVLILGFLILAVLLCVGFDTIYDRLATVRHIEKVEGGRVGMLQGMSQEFKEFPLIGTGLGTHEFVFPMFDHSPTLGLATHADNEFGQLLEEAGYAGLLLALVFLAIITTSYWRCIKNPNYPIQYVAFGLGFSLLAILIHSFSDFGQHVPSNALLTACFTGMLINIARLADTAPENRGDLAPMGSVRAMHIANRIGLALIFVAAGAWCIIGSDAARSADNVWETAMIGAQELHDHQWQGTDAQYIAMLRPASQAVTLQPQNIKYRYLLDLYRWRSLTRAAKKNAGTFQLSTAALPFVSRIVDDLLNATTLCPTYGPTYSLAGELDHFVLNKPQGIALVQTGFKLTPKDPLAAFISGQMALEDHRYEDALVAFRSASAAGGDKNNAIDLLVTNAKRPDLAYQFSAGDSASLSHLIELLSPDNPKDKPLIARCKNDLATILQSDANQSNASPDTIASLATQYQIDDDKPKAILYYRKALALDYSRVEWHYQLATLLAESGDQQGGMGEARICLRIRPQMKEAKALLGDLSVRSTTQQVGQ